MAVGGGQLFIYDGGTAKALGKLYHYAVGGTTLKNVYTDHAMTTPAAQPLVLDANGIASCYVDGDYRMVLKNSDETVTYWDKDNWRLEQYNMGVGGADYGTAVPAAAAINKGQLFSVIDSGNNFIGLYINDDGASFKKIVGRDATSGGAIFDDLILKNPVVDPRYYGAKGDGSTDDTVAIQAAIDYANTINGNVVFAPGTYMCGQLVLKSNVTLTSWGKSPRVATLKLNTSLAHGTVFIRGAGVSDVYINNITIDGNRSVYANRVSGIACNTSAAHVADSSGSGTDIKIENCILKNIGYYAVIIDNTTRLDINRNTVFNVGGSDGATVGSDAIRASSCFDVHIDDNVMYSLTNVSSAPPRRAIQAGSCDRLFIRGNSIKDLDVSLLSDASTAYALDIGGSSSVDCSGNKIYHAWGIDIEVQGANLSDFITVANNTFYGQSAYTDRGIGVFIGVGVGNTNVTVVGNNFHTMKKGIWVRGANNVTVIGNTIENVGQYGILANQLTPITEEVNNISIVGNTIKDASQEGSGLYSAISARAISGCVVGNNISGSNHDYAITLGATNLPASFKVEGNSGVGTLGAIYSVLANKYATLDNTGTPSVMGGKYFVTGGTTTITAFDDGFIGQEIFVKSAHSVTIDFTGTNLEGNGGVDYAMVSGEVIQAVFDGTNWFCTFLNKAAGAANPDTSGLAVADLETEVNELKALLRTKGMLTP